jgi:hypothetical protein
VIIRIQGEGQYRVPSAVLDDINDADNRLVVAAAASDTEAFSRLYQEMLDLVVGQGVALSADEILESDLILPRRDIDFEEARALFVGEGLIPG